MTEKSEECSSNQPVANRDLLGTVVLLEASITVRITEHHKRMEVVPQQLYVPNFIEEGWYTHQRSRTVPRKNQQIPKPTDEPRVFQSR
ncbi:hypothetical protein TNCV_2359471 [Trichonephila clavipes]|nr:hypothetical protein TNCV_2359471 [Trichonephila clavipes]